MSGGKKHRRKRNVTETVNADQVIKKQKFQENKKYLIFLLINTFVFLIAYWFFTNQSYYQVVLWVYFALTLITSSAYIIYNRGFSRKGVSPEMLPDSMSMEEKEEFIADGERRLKKSKWLLTLIFPLILTFFIDMFVLYVAEPILAGLGIF